MGVITLAKNRPILMDDLDVRLLLVEAQKKGSQEMLYVVPFVAKLMDSCNKSKVSTSNFVHLPINLYIFVVVNYVFSVNKS